MTGIHKRGISGERLYAHVFEAKHEGLSDMAVKVIDKTDIVNRLVEIEGFWAFKLNTFVPHELNVRDYNL